jgi:hypothetical protein
MSQVLAQYVAGAIILIGVFLVFSDPEGSANIINAFSNLNTGAIGALQGRSVSQASGPASRRR